MKINEQDLDYIQSFEGFSPTAYYCSAGVKTIGYGHVILPTDSIKEPITKDIGLKLLKQDLAKFELAVNTLVKVPLNQKQFTALVFFVYNIGINAFKDSTLLKLLNQGNYDSVPIQMRRWNKVKGKISQGLINRREKEIEIWNTQP